MARKRNAGNAHLPERWAYKHGAYYYLPRPHEKEVFDGKTWFRLSEKYPEALRVYADRKELSVGETIGSVADRYTIDKIATFKPNTQQGYMRSTDRIRKVLGHNKAALITPQFVYQYLELVKKKHGMNEANQDLKVLGAMLSCAVRWGVIGKNPIKGEVSYFGKRDGLKKERDRYVEDWELAAWRTEANPIQLAFAALVMLTASRKGEILRIKRTDIHDNHLLILDQKTGKQAYYVKTLALAAAIAMALNSQKVESDYLLANTKGNCYMGKDDRCQPFDKSWRRSMERAIENTDLEESFTRHDLRAKVGSDAETEGRAQELLGHTTADMTRKHYRRKVRTLQPTE